MHDRHDIVGPADIRFGVLGELILHAWLDVIPQHRDVGVPVRARLLLEE